MTVLDGVTTKLALAEVEKKSLEAQLVALESSTSARIASLEEEVEALLSPRRTEVARTLYEARIRNLSSDLERARAARERLEQLLRGDAARSEIELARDASVIQAALQHEAELVARLAEAEARLARVTSG